MNLYEICEKSKELAIFSFDNNGNLTKANNLAYEIIEHNKDSKEKLNFNNIFDFRINEVLIDLKKNDETSKELSIIAKNKNFFETKTTFIKTNDGYIAIASPLSKNFKDEKIINKLTVSLKNVSEMLNNTLELDNTLELILDNLMEIINYDRAFVMFLDGDGFSIKASRNIVDCLDDNYSKKISQIGSTIEELLKRKEPLVNNVLQDDNAFVREFGLKVEVPFSYIIAPLTIRDTLFGFVILIKNSKDYFSQTDSKIVKAFADSAAYSVKDAELSNVFKLQLTALKENVIERTKALDVIKAQNLKIVEADKMKNEFLANMSHELRTPLNAIIGFSEALKLKLFGELNAKQNEYVNDIHASGVHLLGMINDLLDLSKIEAHKMKLNKKEFKAIQSVNEVINVVSALANRKNISININNNVGDLAIEADFRKIQQIMYNLLSNSIKFTNNNGVIEIGLNQSDNKIQIYVKDDGIGIPKDYHDKIFQKFQQVDSSYTRKHSSTGLGLTITKELVEMHQGNISLESEIDNGAKFTFEIPIK